jgi:hypothetical protein
VSAVLPEARGLFIASDGAQPCVWQLDPEYPAFPTRVIQQQDAEALWPLLTANLPTLTDAQVNALVAAYSEADRRYRDGWTFPTSR